LGAAVKVLQVSTADQGGGAEAVALSLHRALRARGHDARLAVGYRRTSEDGVLEIAGAGSRRQRALTHPGVLLEALRGHEDFGFPASRRLLDLAPWPPDVVHVHNLHGGYFDLRALPELARRGPLVATLHDAWLLTGHCAHPFDSDGWLRGCGDCPHLDTYPALHRDGTAFNLARKRSIYDGMQVAVVTPSRWLMDMVERSILASAAVQRQVIPNGVDLDVFRPGDRAEARRELGVEDDAALVVFAAQGGRTNEFKDFPTLRAALARLEVPVVAAALGDPTPGAEQVGRATIRSAGEVPPAGVARWLQAADLYVHPSRADTFPSGVLEALACGTPVVASRLGGIPEQLRDETGVLVGPGDPGALASAIESLLADLSRRERMSAAAAEDARTRFSLDRQVDAYAEVYGEAVSARHGGGGETRSSPRVGGG
jgi:glycosyltransferase involved in cell wall biosynthesis